MNTEKVLRNTDIINEIAYVIDIIAIVDRELITDAQIAEFRNSMNVIIDKFSYEETLHIYSGVVKYVLGKPEEKVILHCGLRKFRRILKKYLATFPIYSKLRENNNILENFDLYYFLSDIHTSRCDKAEPNRSYTLTSNFLTNFTKFLLEHLGN